MRESGYRYVTIETKQFLLNFQRGNDLPSLHSYGSKLYIPYQHIPSYLLNACTAAWFRASNASLLYTCAGQSLVPR